MDQEIPELIFELLFESLFFVQCFYPLLNSHQVSSVAVLWIKPQEKHPLNQEPLDVCWKDITFVISDSSHERTRPKKIRLESEVENSRLSGRISNPHQQLKPEGQDMKRNVDGGDAWPEWFNDFLHAFISFFSTSIENSWRRWCWKKKACPLLARNIFPTLSEPQVEKRLMIDQRSTNRKLTDEEIRR